MRRNPPLPPLWTMTLLLTTAVVALPRPGLAEEAPEASRVADAQAALRSVPPILDPEYRHRKRHQLEVAPFGGTYLGASIKKSWMVGTRLLFHLSNMFALGGSYGYQWTAVDRLSCDGPPISDRHTHFLDAELAISNDVAMRLGSSLVEMDLYLTLGGGAIQLDGAWDALGVVGGGVKIYLGLSWLALRIDVNTYIHSVEHPSGARIDADLSAALGLVLLFPPQRSPLER